MGGDGGSIPRRSEMVKLKGRHDTIEADPAQARASRWRTCALSLAKLQAPVVACELGNLYNKDAVLEFILDKKKNNHTDHFAFAHIRKLKDVIPVTLDWAEEKKSGAATQHFDDVLYRFVCPITRTQANGRTPFVLMRNCGCVIAKAALDSIPGAESACLNCSKPLKGMLVDETITINPSTLEEVDAMRRRMESRRLAKASRKQKAKSRKRKAAFIPHKTKQRPGASVNTQFKVQRLEQQVMKAKSKLNSIQGMFNTDEERSAIPLLTSTKIPTAMNIL